jgi:hypothetical protein
MKYITCFAFLLLLCGCEETISTDKLTKNLGSGALAVNEHQILLHSQAVEMVGIENIHEWLISHTNIVIDAMTTIVRGNGYCAGYIVVYHTLDLPKVEKSARDVALEKLTPADRAALGIK